MWSFIEVWLTIYHKDLDGPLTHLLQSNIWTLLHGLARHWHGKRRSILAFAGPVMVLATFALWVLLFVFGTALIVWPNLETHYRADPGMGQLGFVDALYYAGVTGTVLGYGDITPLHPALKLLTFLVSGFGFVLLTGGLTYLSNVVNGAMARNVLALRLRAATHHTGDGVVLLETALRHQEPGDVRGRLEQIATDLRDLQERFHQFTILDLYYRSRRASHDPEPMLLAAAHAALAASVLAAGEPRLRPEANELAEAVTDLMLLGAQMHLPRRVQDALEDPVPEEADRRAVAEIWRRIEAARQEKLPAAEAEPELLALAFRTRVFFVALDARTSWSLDAPAGAKASRL